MSMYGRGNNRGSCMGGGGSGGAASSDVLISTTTTASTGSGPYTSVALDGDFSTYTTGKLIFEIELELNDALGSADIELTATGPTAADMASSQLFSIGGTLADDGDTSGWTFVDAANNVDFVLGTLVIDLESILGPFFTFEAAFGVANTNAGIVTAAGHIDDLTPDFSAFSIVSSLSNKIVQAKVEAFHRPAVTA